MLEHLNHIVLVAAHEGLHHAIKAWKKAKDGNNAKMFLHETWILLEVARLAELGVLGRESKQAAADMAEILAAATQHRKDYRALQDSDPDKFATAMNTMRAYELEFRLNPKKSMRSITFHLMTMRIEHSLTALGVKDFKVPKRYERVSATIPS